MFLTLTDANLAEFTNDSFIAKPEAKLVHFDARIVYQILIKSSQLAGEGSVNIPENITAGVNPHKSNVFVF